MLSVTRRGVLLDDDNNVAVMLTKTRRRPPPPRVGQWKTNSHSCNHVLWRPRLQAPDRGIRSRHKDGAVREKRGKRVNHMAKEHEGMSAQNSSKNGAILCGRRKKGDNTHRHERGRVTDHDAYDVLFPLVFLSWPIGSCATAFRGACPSKRLYRLAAIQPAAQTNSPKGCRHPGRRLPTEPLFPSRPSRLMAVRYDGVLPPPSFSPPQRPNKGRIAQGHWLPGDPSTICPPLFGP